MTKKKKKAKKKVTKKKAVRKKKKSKITQPAGRQSGKLVAFRADSELATLLKKEGNQSAAIVKALREHYSKIKPIKCPRCEGKGIVFRKRKKKKKIGKLKLLKTR